MSDFNSLKIQPSEALTVAHWNNFISKFDELVNERNNGLVINAVTVGRSTYSNSEGKVIDSNGVEYPLDYESIGVTKNNYNLRIQSPNNLYLHTGTREDEPFAVKSKATLTITQSGKVGIGTEIPKEKLEIHGRLLVKGDKEGRINLMDSNHYIKSKAAFGVSIGTYKAEEALVIRETSGNIGIGTKHPKRKLHVYSEIEQSGDAPLTVRTNFGFINIGTRNSEWAHIETGQPLFHFNRGISVATGAISSYGADLKLAAGYSSSPSIVVQRNGKIIIHGEVEFKRPVKFSTEKVQFSNNAVLSANYIHLNAQKYIYLKAGQSGSGDVEYFSQKKKGWL